MSQDMVTMAAPDQTSIAKDRGALQELARILGSRLAKEGNVPSDMSVKLAQECLPRAALFVNTVATLFGKIKRDAFEWHRRISGQEGDAMKPAREVETLAKKILGLHAMEERRKAVAKAEADAKALQAQQTAAEAAGAAPLPPISVKAEPVKVGGAAVSFKREATINDIPTFLRWAADNIVAFNIDKIRDAFRTDLNKLVTRNEALEVPGIAITTVPGVSRRGNGGNGDA